MKSQILFVDDVKDVLHGLRRMLRPMRKKWDVHFANSGKEALAMLEKQPVNIIVSDMRMPGMDGAELLAAVKKKWPDTIRFILSGHSEWEKISHAMDSMHQFIAKPCKADDLVATLTQALVIQELFSNDDLKKLVTNLDSLPSLPSLYLELITELKNEDASMVKIGEIISKDAGMVSKILQLVNSAFFGIPREITNITQAINFLGLDTIKSLALSLHIFNQMDTSNIDPSFTSFLWNHALSVSTLSKVIAKMQKVDTKIVDNAYLSGLLHDSGKLILLSNRPQEYKKAIQMSQESGEPMHVVEKQMFGVTHAELAAYVFGLWGMPNSTIEAILYHHSPMDNQNKTFTALTAVHMADSLFYAIDNDEADLESARYDKDYIESLGMTDQVKKWYDACIETLPKEECTNGA